MPDEIKKIKNYYTNQGRDLDIMAHLVFLAQAFGRTIPAQNIFSTDVADGLYAHERLVKQWKRLGFEKQRFVLRFFDWIIEAAYKGTLVVHQKESIREIHEAFKAADF